MVFSPMSPESDYSLLSTFDALSLSSGIGSHSVSSESEHSSSISEYEHILVPSMSSSLEDSNNSNSDVSRPGSPSRSLGLATPKAKGKGRASRSQTSAAAAVAPIALLESTWVTHKTARRSGRQNRRRLAKQQRARGPTKDEVDAAVGARCWDGLSSEDSASLLMGSDGDDDFSHDKLNSLLGRVSGDDASVMSMEDAMSSIDSFFEEPVAFMANVGNKLKLWQSLCIELGVALPPSRSLADDNQSEYSSRSVTPTPSRSATPTGYSRSSTPTARLPDVPLSLRQCNLLLKSVHINIVDYVERRDVVRRALAHDPQRSETQEQLGYRDLLFPSISALRRYTIKNKKFAHLDATKTEWLTPLLCSLRGGRRRPSAVVALGHSGGAPVILCL